MKNRIQRLQKGEYLAPVYQSHNLDDILVGLTQYRQPIQTGVWHSHEKPMISMVVNGGNMEYRQSKKIQRTKGSINYYHAHEIHRNIYHIFPSIHISVEIEDSFLKKHDYSKSSIEIATQKCTDAHFSFLKIFNDASAGDEQSKESARISFISFLSNALDSRPVIFTDWMTKVRELLHDKWNENISLDELSDHSGIHPVTISKHFRRYFNCTLSEYMRKLKVEHALTLLASSKHSLTEVAYYCDFSDQSHFTRVFKDLTGFLPKNFTKIY